MSVAESGRASGHTKAYEFLVPSEACRPLMHRILPLDICEGKERYSASFASWVSFKELINQVFPSMAVSANLRSFRGRKVTDSRSFDIKLSLFLEIEGPAEASSSAIPFPFVEESPRSSSGRGKEIERGSLEMR
ncbi:hypothetical protein OIU74_010614 [Salix koriyanagi]|uniref:Uncharacterized protein n=1 Tax=Salix koriyanagi TaxID=2511006 RepID=A0A9Q0TDC3_9ROSI|nr:hypothetical protein OIU74_010614 [Salix koriyanagi]